ncbi:uncharacterized protein LOC128548922 [Mercenaria mercenaria]|uniref:uncharacterized protein LOC128548922 n=1 Tax=Mercenaria mercenaria TaxID=6596 RepID=UPI00234F316F|nr:uncharacterized protein LOC128548922 [Mercenaria mercenaria]
MTVREADVFIPRSNLSIVHLLLFMMACKLQLVLLVMYFGVFVKAEVFDMNRRIGCPYKCDDWACYIGIGCENCKTGYSKLYNGVFVGYICVKGCPPGYTLKNEYCVK